MTKCYHQRHPAVQNQPPQQSPQHSLQPEADPQKGKNFCQKHTVFQRKPKNLRSAHQPRQAQWEKNQNQSTEAEARRPQRQQETAQQHPHGPGRQKAPRKKRHTVPQKQNISCCTRAPHDRGCHTSCTGVALSHTAPQQGSARCHVCTHVPGFGQSTAGPHPCSGPSPSRQQEQQSAWKGTPACRSQTPFLLCLFHLYPCLCPWHPCPYRLC